MDRAVSVEIITYAPSAFYHCAHCEVAWREAGVTNRFHEEQVLSSLPADLTAEYQAVSDWVHGLLRRYRDRVTVRVIDAASLEGLLKSLRYGMRRYPAIIVAGEARFPAGAWEEAEKEVARRLT